MPARQRPLISLFSGALGLDLGLEQSGFEIRVAVECNRFAADTIRTNRPDIPVIERRIEDVTTDEILEAAELEAGDPFVVTGGPSCQAFSTAGDRLSISDPRGVMFREFLRVVKEARPRFFVMENVTGVLSAAVRHRPLGKRGPGHPPLKPEEQLGSAFILMLKEIRRTGYYVAFDVVNAADFGVPQKRERLVFIGSRDGEVVALPTPAENGGNGTRQWKTLRQALRGLKDPEPLYSELPRSKAKFVELIPEGGNWRDLPPGKQKSALGGAHASWGGRVGFMRRLAWDETPPALTTRPDSKATMMCHPNETRPLSVRECARLQQFPDDWVFGGGLPQQYIQIGNAVPVGLGKAIGEALKATARRRRRVRDQAVVVCGSEDLLERIANRPTTVLNPIRMRKVKSAEAAKKWLNRTSKRRGQIRRYVKLQRDLEFITAGKNGNGGQRNTRRSVNTKKK